MVNTSNPGKGSLQLDHSTTEANLFEIHINIDFPPLSTNMGISGLGPAPETTRITRLEQTATSGPDASEVFSQMNPGFEQSLPLSPGSHGQQQVHTDDSAPLSAADMQIML